MRLYRFSAAANSDIEAISLYIFDLNPLAANHFLDALEETCELLTGQPLIGRPRPELGENLRSFPVETIWCSTFPQSMGLMSPASFMAGAIYPRSFDGGLNVHRVPADSVREEQNLFSLRLSTFASLR